MKNVFILATSILLMGAACSVKESPVQQCKTTCAVKVVEAEPQWQLALASYTFNRKTLFEVIEKAHECGLNYLEAISWHKISDKHGNMVLDADMSDQAIQELRAKLDENKVKLVGYYVKEIGKDEGADRKMFEFCRKIGIRYIVGEPERSTFPAIDKLAQEYRIKVAIHNHPRKKKDTVYANWHPDSVMRMLDGRSEWMGVCADTGHWVRSRLDPLVCIRKCKGRLISLHLKDVGEKGYGGEDVPYGKGVGQVKDVLAELKQQGFAGTFSIEYENRKVGDKTEDVIYCAQWFKNTAQELGVK